MTTGLREESGARWWAANNPRRAAFIIGRLTALLAALLLPVAAHGNQQYEAMSDSVRSSLRQLIISRPAPPLILADTPEEKTRAQRWLIAMSGRLAQIVPGSSVLQNRKTREQFLRAVHYEATRAGLDPQVMLSVMHVESAFRKYAVSSAGARGLMQVMPFWVKEIGDSDERKLFQLRANLRYGAVILRHYLDRESGNLTRALARYNGSLGSNRYPDLVRRKLEKHWTWDG